MMPAKAKWTCSKDYYEDIKRQCYAMYNTVCVNCGFSDIRALQIDHKDRGRNRLHQRDYGRAGFGLWLAIVKGKVPKEDFQCLCANCNWIKRHTNNEHVTCGSVTARAKDVLDIMEDSLPKNEGESSWSYNQRKAEFRKQLIETKITPNCARLAEF